MLKDTCLHSGRPQLAGHITLRPTRQQTLRPGSCSMPLSGSLRQASSPPDRCLRPPVVHEGQRQAAGGQRHLGHHVGFMRRTTARLRGHFGPTLADWQHHASMWLYTLMPHTSTSWVPGTCERASAAQQSSAGDMLAAVAEVAFPAVAVVKAQSTATGGASLPHVHT